jgi:peptidoglycan/LPS O-acetylase OafA/YrhL
MADAAAKRPFFPELESLRGLAALAVSLCHIFNSMLPPEKNFADFGFQSWAHYVLTSLFSSEGGVAIFFVLSGFVLSLGLGYTVSPRNYATFAVRRIFRILPAAWASVVLMILIRHFYFRLGTPWDYIANGLFLYDADAVPINPPLWSLSVELSISALLPLMVAANSRFSPVFQIALLLMLYWLSSLVGLPLFIRYLFAFQLGIMLPLTKPLLAMTNRYLAVGLFVIALAAVMMPTNFTWHGLIEVRTQTHIEVLGAFYVAAYVYCRKSETLTALLNASAARFLGRISYSMYLVNWATVQLGGWMLGIFGSGAMFNLWTMLGAAAMIIPVNIALAYIGYRLFEVPFIRLGHSAAKWIMASTELSEADPTLALRHQRVASATP